MPQQYFSRLSDKPCVEPRSSPIRFAMHISLAQDFLPFSLDLYPPITNDQPTNYFFITIIFEGPLTDPHSRLRRLRTPTRRDIVTQYIKDPHGSPSNAEVLLSSITPTKTTLFSRPRFGPPELT